MTNSGCQLLVLPLTIKYHRWIRPAMRYSRFLLIPGSLMACWGAEFWYPNSTKVCSKGASHFWWSWATCRPNCLGYSCVKVRSLPPDLNCFSDYFDQLFSLKVSRWNLDLKLAVNKWGPNTWNPPPCLGVFFTTSSVGKSLSISSFLSFDILHSSCGSQGLGSNLRWEEKW